MNLKLQFASLLTIGVLSGFVFTIIAIVGFVMGYYSWMLMIGATIAFSFISWLISPWIQDMVYRWFYKIKFYTLEEIGQENREVADFIRKVCNEHKIKVPKIGVIPDDNPTAFCYGSGAWNSRLILTEGLSTYLSEEEFKAVVAHELGHIIHRDFIVMTVAATLLQILYEMYYVFTRAKQKGGSRKGSGIFVMIGILSYIFYWIGTYILLYLSRIREYYADEFSGEKTKDPNALSMALIKIAYGIMKDPDTGKSARLLESTRAMGIFDTKATKDLGVAYANFHDNKETLSKVMLYDLVSPWAFILELKSTHPLTGKRILRLNEQAKKYSKSIEFNFAPLKERVDKSRLYSGFLADLMVYYLWLILGIAGSALAYFTMPLHKFLFLGFLKYFLIGAGIGIVLKTVYKYSGKKPVMTTTLELMTDVYASPVRGVPVVLEGEIIGRGAPGYILSEDMMFRDRSGLIYLNYESIFPLLGNLFFAVGKFKKLLGKKATATGWFFRGLTRYIDLKGLIAGTEKVKSYVNFWPYIGAAVLVIIGLVIP